jgi:RNA-directed DNA polymerase
MFSPALINEIRDDFIKKYRFRPVNSLFWAFLAHFDYFVSGAIRDIRAGNYQFRDCRLWKPPEAREIISVRCYLDRFVIRMVADYLKKALSPFLTDRYYQKKGKGRHAAIKDLLSKIPSYRYVYKTDVKSYFSSADHDILMSILEKYVKNTIILDLVKQIISPTVLISNRWRTNVHGIPLGCSLSPVLAELYLLELDRAFDQNRDFYYQRFNDDIIVLTKTKWQQKRAVKKVQQLLQRHKLTTRYRKTFIGKTSDLVVYLGCKLFPDGSLGISSESVKRMELKLLRLYERGSSPEEIRSYLSGWDASFGLTRQMD